MPKRNLMVIGLFKKTLFYVALIVTWETVYRTGIFPGNLIPSPFGVLSKLTAGFNDATFPAAITISMKRVVIGYLISLPVGLAVGLIVGRCRYLEDTAGPLLLGLQNLPNVCWVPLAVFWFGFSEWSILFVIVVGSFFSVSLAVISGIKNVPPIYTRLAKTMGAKGMIFYTTVLIPAALPAIINGAKQGWSFAWRGLIAGELLSPQSGLGYALYIGKSANDMDQMVAVMIIIIIIGVMVDKFIFNRLENTVRYRWGLSQATEH